MNFIIRITDAQRQTLIEALEYRAGCIGPHGIAAASLQEALEQANSDDADQYRTESVNDFTTWGNA